MDNERMPAELAARIRLTGIRGRVENETATVEDYQSAMRHVERLPEPEQSLAREAFEAMFSDHPGVMALRAMSTRVEVARRSAAGQPLVPIVTVELPGEGP